MKKTIVAGLLGLTGLLSAQTLPEAIKKTDNENFDAAAADFRQLIAKDPAKGEYYFYYGENYFKSDDVDSANVLYQKGVELNATNPLNYVGLGKVLLAKGNLADAKAQFYKAATLGGAKNTEVMRRTAEAWLATDNKNADEALALAANAVKIESKNPENHLILGDAQLEKNPTDGGVPIKSYKMATTLNPKSTKGILREGKLYQRGRNYQLALEKYKEALAIDATFAPAYREIAELYYLAGQPAKSIENWKKYLELNNSDKARYRFMTALFANKQYAEAVAEYEGLKKSGFKNMYLERIAGYSYAEAGNKDTSAYAKGVKAMNSFFEMAGPSFKYKAADYKYKGLLLLRSGKDSLSKLEMDKAIALDPSYAGDINSELAANAMKAKKYDEAIMYFMRKMNGDPKNLNNNDYYSLGRAYYYSGGKILNESNGIKDAKLRQKKVEEALPYFVKADSAFLKLTELNPTWPVGFFWRAKANAQLDPENEKWMAKLYYEQGLNLVKPEERSSPSNKNNVIEALEYLGAYYVTTKDKAKADETWNMVKELDPNNVKQKNYFNPPKAPAKPAPKKQ